MPLPARLMNAFACAVAGPAVLDALGTTVAAMPIEQLFAHREEMVGVASF